MAKRNDLRPPWQWFTFALVLLAVLLLFAVVVLR